MSPAPFRGYRTTWRSSFDPRRRFPERRSMLTLDGGWLSPVFLFWGAQPRHVQRRHPPPRAPLCAGFGHR